jgi:hypothetical protein
MEAAARKIAVLYTFIGAQQMGLPLRCFNDFSQSSAFCLNVIVLVDSMKRGVELMPSFSIGLLVANKPSEPDNR